MQHIELCPRDYLPVPPAEEIRRRFGIGIVGCGDIALSSHLPAYRAFGYRVLACCDIVPSRAEAAQRQFGIPLAPTRIEELLERSDVQVVDLAVPPQTRVALVHKIAAAGKHVFSQKPFAMNLPDAERMVDACRFAGVTLMVNQNARWAPFHRALKVLLERGAVGHLFSLLHISRSFADIAGSWMVSLENFDIVDYGIHSCDLTRYFTGRMPVRVKATTAMVPGQAAVTPMVATILLEYEPSAQVMSTLHLNAIVPTRGMSRYEWILDGSEAWACASQTELVVSSKEHPETKQVLSLQGRWSPDAFGGSMGEMLTALAEGREPQTSGQDNLNSLKIALAAVVESANTGRAVELA